MESGSKFNSLIALQEEASKVKNIFHTSSVDLFNFHLINVDKKTSFVFK